MQPVPRVSRADVERVVRREFPASQHAEATAILDAYDRDGSEAGRARIQLAVLKLSRGSLVELRRNVREAELDFRDVLAAAEYPAASRNTSFIGDPVTPGQQQIFEEDWEQYRRWLERP